MPDYDARIVALYDGDNPDGPDHDYYRSLAAGPGVRRILDLGCGTGILTVTLATEGKEVVGVDPSPAMLDYARRRPGAEAVTWIDGDSSSVTDGGFDLIVMTGNVPQHIPDTAWEHTLRDLHRVAEDGAILAFESRNPAARAWEGWTTAPATRQTELGPLTEWREVTELGGSQVELRAFNRFESSDEVVEERQVLTFRGAERLTEQLATAGFEVADMWGDWRRSPFDGSQPLIVTEARRRLSNTYVHS